MCSFLVLLLVLVFAVNVGSESLVMIINGVTNCIPFDEISLVDGYQIGWIKVISCIEDTKQFSYHQNTTLLARYAISIKIIPPGGTTNTNYNKLAVIAKPYSNPVNALRDNVEVSYQYIPSNGNVNGFANIANWIGSSEATDRLSNNCYGPGAPNDLSNRIYHACGNYCGMHINPGSDDIAYRQCDWQNCGAVGENIEIYFGFEPMVCSTTSSPTDVPTIGPTTNPTKTPTINPTKNPVINPTITPSYNPSALPSKTPTVTSTEPTRRPQGTKKPTNIATLNNDDDEYKTTNISDIYQLKTTKQVEAEKTESQVIVIVIVAGMVCCVLLLFIGIVIRRLNKTNTKIGGGMNVAMSSVDCNRKRIGSCSNILQFGGELKSKQMENIIYNMNAKNDKEIEMGGNEIQTMGNSHDINKIVVDDDDEIVVGDDDETKCDNHEIVVGEDDEILDVLGENNQNIENNIISSNGAITIGESDSDSDSVLGTATVTNGEQ